jgi:hypothetical protein
MQKPNICTLLSTVANLGISFVVVQELSFHIITVHRLQVETLRYIVWIFGNADEIKITLQVRNHI